MSERVVPFRPTAADAWNRIDTHEKVCAERYGNMRRDLSDIKLLLWTVACSLAATGLVVIGYLITHVVPSLKP